MLELRLVEYKDNINIDNFCTLARDLYREYYYPVISNNTNKLLFFLNKTTIENEIKEQISQYYLIKYNNKDAGVLALQKYNSNTLHIAGIFLRKNYRKKGLGKKIIALLQIKAKTENYSYLRITPVIENKKLKIIFEKLGFEVQKEIARYFGDNIYVFENVMIKEIYANEKIS